MSEATDAVSLPREYRKVAEAIESGKPWTPDLIASLEDASTDVKLELMDRAAGKGRLDIFKSFAEEMGVNPYVRGATPTPGYWYRVPTEPDADVFYADDERTGVPEMLAAVRRYTPEIAEYLSGVDSFREGLSDVLHAALLLAADSSDVESARKLLTMGAHFQWDYKLRAYSEFKRVTAAEVAVRRGAVDMVRLFMDDLRNDWDISSDSSAHYAGVLGDVLKNKDWPNSFEMAKLIIEKAMDTGDWGEMDMRKKYIDMAARNNRRDVLQFLMKLDGSGPGGVRDFYFHRELMRPAQIAFANGHLDLAKFLATARLDKMQEQLDWTTLVMYNANEGGFDPAIYFMFDWLTASDVDGVKQTAAHLLGYLISRPDVDIDAEGPSGRTLLSSIASAIDDNNVGHEEEITWDPNDHENYVTDTNARLLFDAGARVRPGDWDIATIKKLLDEQEANVNEAKESVEAALAAQIQLRFYPESTDRDYLSLLPWETRLPILEGILDDAKYEDWVANKNARISFLSEDEATRRRVRIEELNSRVWVLAKRTALLKDAWDDAVIGSNDIAPDIFEAFITSQDQLGSAKSDGRGVFRVSYRTFGLGLGLMSELSI